MFHSSHHPVIAVRAPRRATPKVRPPNPAALLLSSLILIAAAAPVAAEPAKLDECSGHRHFGDFLDCVAKEAQARDAARKAEEAVSAAKRAKEEEAERVKRQLFLNYWTGVREDE